MRTKTPGLTISLLLAALPMLMAAVLLVLGGLSTSAAQGPISTFIPLNGEGEALLSIGYAGLSGIDSTGSGQILYTSAASWDLPHDLYVMNADGTNVRKLTNGPGWSEEGRFSPDGTKIVFTSNRSGSFYVYSMNSDGTNVRQLAEAWDHSRADWSPNGRLIAYRCKGSGICVMNADGTNIHHLTSAYDDFPRWSPDGSKILFFRFVGAAFTWDYEVFVMNADGSNQINLSNSPTTCDWQPDWSPDGSQIAFGRWAIPYADGSIIVMNADGTNAHSISGVEQNDGSPVWSPDGTRMAIQSSRAGMVKNVFVIDANGSNGTRLTYRDEWPTDWWSADVQPPASPSLLYVGPRDLPSDAWTLDEVDRRITAGDHVHLFLPFKNTGNQPLVDAKVRISGTPKIGRDFGISIWNGTSWLNWQQSVSITPSTLQPGQVGVANFWIYVTDNDPDMRSALGGKAWLRIESGSNQWTLPIRLDPIAFSFNENSSMKAGSCLHNPTNFGIQRYAQYAAAAWTMSTPPTNADDPDMPEQAVKNLVKRVKAEFAYNDIWAERQSDTTLLAQRNGYIGVCRDYADLTVGLLRSLGLPTRYTDSIFRSGSWWRDGYKYEGHAWAEVYLGGMGWRQADSTWSTALNEAVYEARGYQVMEAWADRFPLSSATIKKEREYQCIASCYTPPVFCTTCKQDSLVKPPNPELSCVENVTSRYHEAVAVTRSATIEKPLDISISAPNAVTRTVPFTLETLIVNRGNLPLGIITATVATSEYVDSQTPLLDVAPPYATLSQLGPGQGVTLTWTITPQTTGSSIPLLVTAETADLYTLKEQTVSVNEPGTLPDLTILEGCDSATVNPGQPVTLTASLLDQYRQPLTDAASVVTASLRSAADTAFLLTTQMPYCVECGYYRQSISLPADAPLGRYDVELHAGRPGYDSDESRSSFFVAPVLDIMVEVAPQSVLASMPFTITAHVTQRGITVEEGLVLARIVTPGGEVTLPLNFSAGVYSVTLSPEELRPDLPGPLLLGHWTIQVTPQYLGSSGVASTSINVREATYLPLLLRGH